MIKQSTVRLYKEEDYEGLLAVQKEAFPPPFPEDLWWSREHIKAHVETFPEGALLAEIDGTVVGSATSLLLKHSSEPHTWEEVSDDGYIKGSHDPDGETLYGIDLCVRPTYRNFGIAHDLYEARKQTVRDLGLARLVAGCRIPGYHHVADRLSPEQYVDSVVAGIRKDLVLSFMLKQGMKPILVMPGYLDDEESMNVGVLVEWTP
ncbi:GNAT family N-acetyltransferase [Shouchella shacheensis]|uniref:GNAT family N-acetyltransferase n=1 Tax=Shouchella shacheensis TaxID=1649580 RepID=UPI00074049ED|nr:GNAT family N-acetyltransferase [Shouchella shacheensis]